MSWQVAIQRGLEDRDMREKAYSQIIEHHRRLSQQTSILKERNKSLLKAASSVREGSTGGSRAPSGTDTSVARAYTASLESQLSLLREELAALYKVQGQNAQRLLVMNESLREREERSRAEEEELKGLRLEVARLKERVSNHAEVMREKERNVQIVQDELATLQLEYVQLEQHNDNLKRDNASLLQRWLDHKNSAVEKMNAQFAAEADTLQSSPPASSS